MNIVTEFPKSNILPFPGRNGSRRAAPADGREPLDLNEFVTGGRQGFITYPVLFDQAEFGLKCLDVLIIDGTDKRPSSRGLLWVKNNGRCRASREAVGDVLGTIRFVLRAVEGGAR